MEIAHMNMNMSMSQYYIGQRVVASDGAQYTLTHHAEGVWWAQQMCIRDRS